MKVNQVLITINGKRRFRITADTINKVFDCDYAINTIEIRVTESTCPRSHFKNAIVVFEEEYEDTFNLNHMLSNFKQMIEKLFSYDGDDVATYALDCVNNTVNAIVTEINYRCYCDNHVNVYGVNNLTENTAVVDSALYLLNAYSKEDISSIRVYALNAILNKEVTLFEVHDANNIKQYTEVIKQLYNLNMPFTEMERDCFYMTAKAETLLFAELKNNTGVLIDHPNNREYIAYLSAHYKSIASITIAKTIDKFILFRRFAITNERLWYEMLKTDLFYCYLDVDTTLISSLAGVFSLIPYNKRLKRELYKELASVNNAVVLHKKYLCNTTKKQVCKGLTPKELQRLYYRHGNIKGVDFE